MRAWEQQRLGLVDGERVLDVGCGCGDAAISLGFDLGPAGEMVGVDASAAMLEVARQRSSEVPCAVRFSVGDPRSLDEADQPTLHLDVGDPQITKMVRNGLRAERNRPSNIGRRLAALATAAGCEVTMETTDTQIWTRWNPDESPAPDGCFSMTSLAEDLVEKGQLEAGDVSRFVGKIHEAARRQRFNMSLTMHAAIAVRP
ncbi:methyltransferase domain-containing protein [Ilumatobacter sp.]|uniref:methyltransferase domain-containing protein n=1 Tax=Ilumatobacter sp. TaxID=1967498 RepID=UPI0037536730